MDICLLSLFVLLVFVFAARAILNGANSELSDNEREKLIDLFTWSGICNISRLILMLVLFFLSMNIKYISLPVSLSIYISAIGVLLFTSCSKACKKLKDAHFSQKYIKAYIIATILRTTGLVLFFILIVAND